MFGIGFNLTADSTLCSPTPLRIPVKDEIVLLTTLVKQNINMDWNVLIEYINNRRVIPNSDLKTTTNDFVTKLEDGDISGAVWTFPPMKLSPF
jgi:hypothetical protein